MLRLALIRLTSCSGCQLTLLNAEEALPQLVKVVTLVYFPLATSLSDDGNPVDLVLVEGAVSRPEEIRNLLRWRHRSRYMAALGTCALSGGVNALAPKERLSLCQTICGDGDAACENFAPQPVRNFVRVDLELPGCPPDVQEILRSIASIAHGGLPQLVTHPLCFECRLTGSPCLLLEKSLPCLGPITRGGCNAHCPGRGIPCEGCRGDAEEANYDEAYHLLCDLGISRTEVQARVERFNGGTDADR